jgi:hypothetical protein
VGFNWAFRGFTKGAKFHWSTTFNFFLVPRTSTDELLAVLFMLNSDMYAECFYQAGFQRYRGIKMRKMVLHVLMKQAETSL